MKHSTVIPLAPTPCLRLRRVFTATLGPALFVLGLEPAARAGSGPPDKMTYQGYLVMPGEGGMDTPLANDKPTSYLVVFRIWKSLTGTEAGESIWSEQQTVLVNKGEFSVILGDGQQFQQESRPTLSSVFAGESASDRYLEITVTIDGSPVQIKPRLRLLPAPYAFLAQNAQNATAIVGPNGTPLVTAADGKVSIAGELAATRFNATQITDGTLADARLSANVALREGGNRFKGSQIITDGNVGVGTTAPQATLHVAATNTPARILIGQDSASGGYTTLSAGVSAVTSGYASLQATKSSGTSWGDIVLNPEGGNVGIGTSAPEQRLHVRGTLRVGEDKDSSTNKWDIYVDAQNRLVITDPKQGASGVYLPSVVEPGGGTATWFYNSDQRLKKDITPLGDVLPRVLQLRPVSYRFKASPDDAKKSIGLIAQEVEPLFPEVVGEREGLKSLAYAELAPIAIAAVQELNGQVQTLRDENTALKQRLASLEAAEKARETRTAALERLVQTLAQAQGERLHSDPGLSPRITDGQAALASIPAAADGAR